LCLRVHDPDVGLRDIQNLAAGAPEDPREDRGLVLQQEGTKRDGEDQPEILGAIAGQHFEGYQVHATVSFFDYQMMTIILRCKKKYGFLSFCVGVASKADA